MSLVAIGRRLISHGTIVIRNTFKRQINTTALGDKINAIQLSTKPAPVANSQAITKHFPLRNIGIQIGLQARRILIDNVLNRVTNSLASDLRKKAARRILYGDSGPFLAFVGVSLASGTGILTKEEELEGVCYEIRNAVSKIKWHFNDIDINAERFENEPINLDDLLLARPMAKGSNGVVFPAALKTVKQSSSKIVLADGVDSMARFPLAVKMMFNYDIQSNAVAILKAMYRETVPARVYHSNTGSSEWEMDLSSRKRHLPPHPNIVSIYSVFTDYVREFENCRDLCPAALPRRIHEDGEGRNMSLFLVMKRYQTDLRTYLQRNELNTRTAILLLTQLFEAIAHLTAHGIAHRDIKSDNLLLDMNEDELPILVVSDFGCCLADRCNGLQLPYTSYEIDKGGNTALMAPEIINQRPGTFSVLNYSKSDLWAAGTIAYELFGMQNPFYGGGGGSKRLRNTDYKLEDLPELPNTVPGVIKILVKNILERNPNKRLDPDLAANICQLFLWAPSSWIKAGIGKLPSSTEILQWLLSLTTKILCEGRINNKTFGQNSEGALAGRRTYPEYLLISSFLVRAKLSQIRTALSWIKRQNEENELV